MPISERIAAAVHLADFYADRDDPRSQLLAARYLSRARVLSRRLVVAHT